VLLRSAAGPRHPHRLAESGRPSLPIEKKRRRREKFAVRGTA